ncbi:MAG: hypothetical protein AB1442_15635, partial [Nitrospirota bacterium]
TGLFLRSDPPSEKDIADLNSEIISILNSLNARVGRYMSPDTGVVGTAGTFSTLASIDLGLDVYSREKMHMHRIPLSRLEDMSRRLLSLPLAERKKVRGLEPDRADLIIPGLQFTISIMRTFGFQELVVSEYGILEGVLLEIHGKNISETGKP